MALDVEEERAALVDRSAEIASVLLQQKRRLLLRVRITRIPEGVPEVVEARSVKLVGPRLGEDFDSAVAELVEFRRKRILVDADLANGLLGRKLASAESVDEDGAATRTGGGSG